MLKRLQKLYRVIGLKLKLISPSERVFHSSNYLRHNARKLEHLASLRIPVSGLSVLEVGAGIGDHSHYYIDRGCDITITEGRQNNLDYLETQYPDVRVKLLDMERPITVEGSPFDVVHCYGLLYHLSAPDQAIGFMSRNCKQILFLETCVSFGDDKEINLVSERADDLSQSLIGIGCRPTRRWIFEELKKHFENVYIPKTQPNHEEFPINWSAPEKHTGKFNRAVFVCSRKVLKNDMLTTKLLDRQWRHE